MKDSGAGRIILLHILHVKTWKDKLSSTAVSFIRHSQG